MGAVIGTLVILILTALTIGIFLVLYRRRKRGTMLSTSCENILSDPVVLIDMIPIENEETRSHTKCYNITNPVYGGTFYFLIKFHKE